MEPSEIFKKYLKYLLNKQKRGAQVKLANQADVTPKHLNDYLGDRRSMSESDRVKLSNALGYQYEEFLVLGRKLFDSQNNDNSQPIELIESSSISPKDLIPDLKKLSANDLKIIAELLKRFTQ